MGKRHRRYDELVRRVRATSYNEQHYASRETYFFRDKRAYTRVSSRRVYAAPWD